MFDYTADNLIQSARDILYAGSSSRDWDDTKLLRLINRQVHEYLLPFIIGAHKEYFLTYQDQALVASQGAYLLPSKASAEKIRAVQLVDSSGNPYSQLNEMAVERAVTFGSSSLVGPLPQGIPQAYYFRGNAMVLLPVPSGSPGGLSLRIYYAARPSTLVKQVDCVKITNLTGGGGAAGGHFRVGIGATVPAGYTAAVSCDLVQNSPGFDVLLSGAISSITAGTFVDFVGTIPTGLAVGDWLCLADTAPVVTGMPAEILLGCLINKVALEVLASKADDDDFKRRERLLARSEKEAIKLLSSRRNAGQRDKAGTGSLFRFRRGGGTLPF